MKNIILGLAIIASGLTACSDHKETNNDKDHSENHDMMDNDKNHHMDGEAMQGNNMGTAENMKINNVLTAYLSVKNALANDDPKAAATAGKEVSTAVQNIDAASLSAEQKKMYEEVKNDMIEHGDHIAENAGKIAHQREHFDMISADMYDLVKTFGTGQTLYKAHCPMFNDNKGASWISETKEIKNPYMGKKMSTCGTVKEEIKK